MRNDTRTILDPIYSLERAMNADFSIEDWDADYWYRRLTSIPYNPLDAETFFELAMFGCDFSKGATSDLFYEVALLVREDLPPRHSYRRDPRSIQRRNG